MYQTNDRVISLNHKKHGLPVAHAVVNEFNLFGLFFNF